MAGYGFNTDVRVGDQIYHVQTEPCRRPTEAIETSIFQAGLVQYVRRAEYESDHQLDERVRAQHGAVIAELKEGALRGLGPALDLLWNNAAEADPASGGLRVTLRVVCGQLTAAHCRVRATLHGDGDEAPLDVAEAVTDGGGEAELRLTLPAGTEPAPLRLVLEAERGLSLGLREFRLS